MAYGGDMQQICDDLEAEHAALDAVVAPLDASAWGQSTPAAGWSIGDSISHLWFFDQRARLALHPDTVEEFRADAARLTSGLTSGVDPSVEVGRAITPAELLANWRADRSRLIALARSVDPSARIPWYGPAMAARSFITARLMETWAHGQDIRDALGLAPEATERLRHVAHIGVRARPFAYATNSRALPDADVRVELRSPSGELWEWGDASSVDRVTGSALEFCLVATQRRHVADTSLAVSGPLAAEWMGIAQAFAGPPGGGRRPGTFRS
ncbi:MAG: hypothetical protein RL219_4 [Actinomycetota bacterium]